MKKKFSLQTMEMAEAAVKDAPNFGLSAKIEQDDGEISVAYECKSETAEKESLSMENVYSIVRSVYSECEYQMKWLREDLGYMRQSFAAHMKGHLPAVLDAGKMEGAIKALGLADSYNVSKPTIWVEY
jgi:hypothetical protein